MRHNPGFLALVNEAKKRIREIAAEEVARKITRKEPFHLIDVREESEWGGGRIRGAIHLGKGILERDIETRVPDKDAEIVLYCGGGYRSALSADHLQTMGYGNVRSMEGGWREWTRRNLPTE
jgi:rhodanese-related sulfurtransferase